MPWARHLTVGVAVLAALHLVVAVGFAVQEPTAIAAANLGIALAVVPASSALSILIARRPDGAVVGCLLGLLSLAVSHVVAKEVWLQWLGTTGSPEQQAWLVAATAENAWWVLGTLSLLLLFFPDGHLPSRRWIWVPPALVVCVASAQVYGAFADEPFRPPLQHLDSPFGDPPLVVDVLGGLFFPMLVLFLACATSLIRRYRRSDLIQRRQIKWLALAGIGLLLYPLLCGVEILLWGRSLWISAAVGIASLVAIPAAAALAVLRHDLYDVDKVIVLAVTWGVVTTALLAVHGAVSSLTGLLVGRGSEAGVAVGTAAAALVLVPAVRVVRRAVDARMYPLRRAALGAVTDLNHEVSAGRARPESLQDVLRSTLRDPWLRVGYRVPGAELYLDADGEPVLGSGVPVRQEEQQTGVLVPGSGPASAELLREVAGRCATLVEVVRLRTEVARALEDAEASRARLVSAGYEERRRLERDLHDGAQQRLVSLGMALRLAQRHLDDGTVDVDGLLDESVAQLGTAVAELRQIAHGLRPASLDDGLAAALARLTRSLPITIELHVDPDPLPDAVATTAYYVVSEALANAVKHADAGHITMAVTRHDGQVVVRVSDDGRGGAHIHRTSSLADRVAALGGSLTVTSPHGRGTDVQAMLPCAS
jgi:signal transduction histidine kinase